MTNAVMGGTTYSYAYDPVGDQKSAKPKTESPGDCDFEAAQTRGARSDLPRRSGNCNRRLSAACGTVTEYGSNPLNQYTNISGGSASSPTSDADCNMLTNGPWAYTWDAENRMTSACSNGVLLVTKFRVPLR